MNGDSTPGISCLRRILPERVRDLYRRLRDRILRRLYNPKRFWTRWGRRYILDFPPDGARSEDIFVALIVEFQVRSMVDVGCGYGRYLKALREKLSLDRLAGVDISPTQIEHARNYLARFPDVELFVAPATKLPFPDGAFDAVMTYSLMIHLRPAEVSRFLSEARRVARRLGFFLESSINPDKPHLNPPYYFAHDYPRLFAEHGLSILRRVPVNVKNNEFLYVVNFMS